MIENEVPFKAALHEHAVSIVNTDAVHMHITSAHTNGNMKQLGVEVCKHFIAILSSNGVLCTPYILLRKERC